MNRLLGEMIAANPDLLALYCLRGDPFKGGDRVSAQSKIAFLLWFAVFGKAASPNSCLFDDRYVGFLHSRLPSGATLLRNYLQTLVAAERDADPSTARSLDEWVTERTLGPLMPGPNAGALRFDDLRRHGVSIVGFPRHTLGLGEDARSLFKVLRALDVPVSLVDVGNDGLERFSEAQAYDAFILPRPIFPTVVFCMPLFEYVRVRAEWGTGALAGRRLVGYWPWELTAIDACWQPFLDGIDEIWASTTFLCDVYCGLTAKPVLLMPMLVDIETPDAEVLERYGLPRGGFTALAFADLNSTLKRKNVLGAIQAFRQAFAPEIEDVRLIVKTTHLEGRTAEWAMLDEAIGGDERIVILDGALTRAETLGLLASVDVFMSLHRAEGFGRVLAEAMAVGTPVIATDWSGSRDLIGPDTGYPVRCTSVVVAPDHYPEAAGRWAEPDIDHAAAVLHGLKGDRQAANARVAQARRHIEDHYSLRVVSEAVAARLVQIRTLC